ncbi:MAG: hypothetical protein ACR2J6_05695 [Thermoleophilaceae bacterium]
MLRALTIGGVRLPALFVLCAAVLLLGLSGCGREEPAVLSPVCREGSDAMLRALRRAPSPVSLGGTPLSSCVRDAGDGGDLRDVGVGYLDAAAVLATAAEKNPEGPEALRLGYLVGAAHRGASSDQGPASEMVRRLDNEATRADKGSAAFGRGERAGRRGG